MPTTKEISGELKDAMKDLPWVESSDPKNHRDDRYTYVIVPVPVENLLLGKEFRPQGMELSGDEDGNLCLRFNEWGSWDSLIAIASLITAEKTPTEINEYHTQVGYITEPKFGQITWSSPESPFSPGGLGYEKFSRGRFTPQELLNNTEEGSYNSVDFHMGEKIKVTGLYFNAQGKSYKSNDVYRVMLARKLPLVVLNKPLADL